MRLRRAVWRLAGPAAGRAAPGPVRAYYDAVVGSLVRALLRRDEVLAIYARGSLVRGDLDLGRSDVDLVVVVEDEAPSLLPGRWAALRAPYGRRQGVLPIDVFPCTRSELDRCGGWLAFARPLLAGGWRTATAGWRLLGGSELRPADPWEPDRRLAYLTDRALADALALAARGDAAGLRARLATLERDARRERLDWPEAAALMVALERLDAPRPGRAELAAGVVAALCLHDEHRRRNALPTTPRGEIPVATGSGEPGLAGAPGALRAATLVRGVGEGATLVLEAGDRQRATDLVEWALDGPAAGALARGRAPLVLTSRLAEDAWRSPLRHAALAASTHLAGEPLAPRAGLPEPALGGLALEHQGFVLLGAVRRVAVGQRGAAEPDGLDARVDALAGLARLPAPAAGPAAARVEALWRRLVAREAAAG